MMLPAVFLAAGCASTPRDVGRGCELSAADSAMAGGQPLFRDCAVDEEAKALSRRVPPPRDFRPEGPACYKATVRLVVAPNGRPERNTIDVLTATSDAFRKAVLAAAPYWMYSPAERDGEPVRQVVEERVAIGVAVRVRSTQQGTVSESRPRNCR